MDNKIRIKFLQNLKKDEEYVLASLATLAPEVLITNIHMGSTQATLTLHNVSDLSKLVNKTLMDKLIEKDLELIPPPTYFPSLTVFANKVKPFFDMVTFEIEIEAT